MIKYAISKKDNKLSVFQIECEKLSTYQYLDSMFLPEGEAYYNVLAPKQLAGEIWHSHAIFDSPELAAEKAADRTGFEKIDINYLDNTSAELLVIGHYYMLL